jgi:hypothetical protein
MNSKTTPCRGKRTSPAPCSDFLSEQLRLLRGAGWKAHARDFERCVSALKVINTWASYLNGRVLDADNVVKLTEKALAPFRNPNAPRQVSTRSGDNLDAEVRNA